MTLSYHHLFQPGTDPSAPPLLLLHGTGGDEHDLVPLAQKLSPGSAVLSPRGDVSEHGARRFFARLAEGVFDPAEVTRRTQALADFVAAASSHCSSLGSALPAPATFTGSLCDWPPNSIVSSVSPSATGQTTDLSSFTSAALAKVSFAFSVTSSVNPLA